VAPLAYIHINLSIFLYLHDHVYMNSFLCTESEMHIYIYIYIHIYICIYIYTYIYQCDRRRSSKARRVPERRWRRQHIYRYIYPPIEICVFMYTCACIYTNKDIYIFTNAIDVGRPQPIEAPVAPLEYAHINVSCIQICMFMPMYSYRYTERYAYRIAPMRSTSAVHSPSSA